MVIICPNCGKINEVKERKWRRPSLSIACRHCGYETTVHLGTTSHSAESIRCPACGYSQKGQINCVKCQASLYQPQTQDDSKASVPDGAQKKPPAQVKVIKFLTVGLTLLVLLTMGILAGTLYVIKASAAYRTAESFILNSEEIRAVVGDQPRFGLLPAGSVRTSKGQGTAEFEIHVKGSKGETDVRIILRSENGRWRVVSAVFTDAGGTRQRITGG